MPLACLREVTVLISLTRDLMHNIVCPTLVIHSREDHIVPPANAMAVIRTISSDDIRLLWLNNSYHVATLDNDKDLIVERIGGILFRDGEGCAGREGDLRVSCAA